MMGKPTAQYREEDNHKQWTGNHVRETGDDHEPMLVSKWRTQSDSPHPQKK
jgi:hypothetical protein